MPTVLTHGNFIGESRGEVTARGFSFKEVLDRVDGEVPRHTHEDAHFLLVVRGAYITSAADALPLCTSPTLIFNPAGTTHRDRFQTRGGLFFTVSVGRESLDLFPRPLRAVERPTGFRGGEILRLALGMYKEMRAADDLSPVLLEGMALELLGRAARLRAEGGPKPPRWLRRAREMVHDRRDESVPVGEIAEAVGVHPVHLARAFRRHYGATVGEYARRLRVEHARRQLAATDLPLSRIATAAGFYDQSHFSRTFKRATGVSPAEYRRLFSRLV
ncbi:MAG TPA: AraC family transcriptional regulator [Pyrinomonadaceae bacterium]|nr:AraC family transcriptional regulator [Pyrinomonadaceae bacterium]